MTRLLNIRPPFKVQPETVLVQDAASVFDGLTHSKAVLVNETFRWFRVAVRSQDDIQRGYEREEYVFKGMGLPGERPEAPMMAAYDLVLLKSPGQERVISPNLVAEFEIVSRSEVLVCKWCGAWRESAEMRQVWEHWDWADEGEWVSECALKPCTNLEGT